jgi:DNA-directed RNA polymerase subunit RPC12/RpoP
MSDQFICISCWQEFKANADETEKRSGNVVCPKCGYIQPLPTDNPPEGKASDSGAASKDHGKNPAVVEEISWNTFSVDEDDDEDIPIGEEERTDRVEIPPELLTSEWSQDVGMEDDLADEKTPLVPISEGQSAILLGLEETTSDSNKETKKADWQLKTPSGLTFKFTDPEAMLGWKKKIATYKELHVSPDGERWADFSRFVRQYEETGDPLKAFILSESMADTELPPPAPELLDEDLPARAESTEETDSKRSRKGKKGKRVGTTTAQFTFKVQDKKESGWGKYLVLAIVGLALGAGIVLTVLYFTGQLDLPFELDI